MSEQITQVFVAKEPLDQAKLDELEEMLIEADLGPHSAARITERFAAEKFGKDVDEAEIKEALAAGHRRRAGAARRATSIRWRGPRPYVVLFIGVNGSGKTTTLGKIAADLTSARRQGAGRGRRHLPRRRRRAAEGLGRPRRAPTSCRGRRTPTPPAWPSRRVERARAQDYDVVLIDTAGRLQNKQGLMDELHKIIRVVKKLDPDAPHETLLVLDATVGRNALAQENIFGNQIGVSGIVMTKLDGTARGGVLVPVAQASDSPIKLIGVGEGIDDLQPFDARAFARSLVGPRRSLSR